MQEFSTKLEAAKYLQEKLASVAASDLEEDVGLFAGWLR